MHELVIKMVLKRLNYCFKAHKHRIWLVMNTILVNDVCMPSPDTHRSPFLYKTHILMIRRVYFWAQFRDKTIENSCLCWAPIGSKLWSIGHWSDHFQRGLVRAEGRSWFLPIINWLIIQNTNRFSTQVVLMNSKNKNKMKRFSETNKTFRKLTKNKN